MKVNLLLNGDSPRSGYLNLDPLADPSDPLKTQGDICNLDDYVDDAEVDELIALDVIDFLPANHLNKILDNWIRKIRYGGELIMGGVDIYEVARGIVKRELSIDDANIILYGSQLSPYNYRKATITLQSVIEVMENRGFKILQKRVENYRYYIKVQRPFTK